MDVLISGSMGTIAQSVKRNLETHGVSSAVFDIAQNTFRDEFGYHRGLTKAIAQHNPKMVMPVGNQVALSRYKHPDGLICICEREDKLRLLESKVRCTQLAGKLGILQPRFYKNSSEVPDSVQVIFKRDISFGGQGVRMPKNKKSLENLISKEKQGTYIIQDWIEGTD